MQDLRTFTLRSGISIPSIGFGPGIMRYPKLNKVRRFISRVHGKLKTPYSPLNKYKKSVKSGLQVGFNLLDYSNTYGNLELIGQAIRESGLPRESLFLTTRISNASQMNGSVREGFLTALSQLGVEYIDLLQFHWPVTDKFIDTWKEMIRLKEEGYVRVLGVANCHQHHLEALEQATGVLPEVNQIEVHPLFTQKNLVEYCKAKGIQVEAYTPIARHDDRLVRLPILKKMETKYNKSLIQIILRWHIQNGIIPVVKSLNPQHQQSNLEIFDFELSDEDMKLIDSININSRLRYDPDNCDFSIL